MKVKFFPQDKEFEIDSDTSVLDSAKEHGIQIKSVCGGIPSCAECRVQIKEGEFNVFPPSAEELTLIGTAHFVDKSRLSCQLKCFGDVTIDLTEQIEKQARGTSTKKVRGSKTQQNADARTESFARQGSLLFEDEKIVLDTKAPKAKGAIATMVEDERQEDQEEVRQALQRIKGKRNHPKSDDSNS